MPDEITYLFAVFPLSWGLPGLVWLGTVYEFKDQLLSLFGGGECGGAGQQYQILVY